MGLMDVIVRTVVTGVIVVMHRDVSMIVAMFVLVVVLVAVLMRVLMGVCHVPVGVFVGMAVVMVMGVQMLVLVVALHGGLLSFSSHVVTELPLLERLRRCSHIVNHIASLNITWHSRHPFRLEGIGSCHEMDGRSPSGKQWGACDRLRLILRTFSRTVRARQGRQNTLITLLHKSYHNQEPAPLFFALERGEKA